MRWGNRPIEAHLVYSGSPHYLRTGCIDMPVLVLTVIPLSGSVDYLGTSPDPHDYLAAHARLRGPNA